MKCFLCASPTWESRFPSKDRMFGLPGKFTVVRCRGCGMVRIDPQPSAKVLARYYPKTYYSYGVEEKVGIFLLLRSYMILHSLRPTVWSQLLSWIVHVPAIPTYISRGKIIDVGCGNGDTLLLLKKLGWDVYGLDIDRGAINRAHARGLQHVRFGSYNKLAEYPDNYFDAIRLYLVIEHLDDPQECLQLVRRKVKKGGQVIIGTANIDAPIARMSGQYWYHLDTPRHLVLFSERTLSRLADKENLTFTSLNFCSAGGVVGTIQYYLAERFGFTGDLINNPICILLFYPLERLLDWFKLGDIIVVNATK